MTQEEETSAALTIPYLGPTLAFPPVTDAVLDGILAAGGDLSVERLRLAYWCGIFPWPYPGYPLLWWSPDPRFVLRPDEMHVPKSLERVIRSGRFRVTLDGDFRQVIERCRSTPRPGQEDTWITADMVEGYCRLHDAGDAHSVEVWLGERLVGGLYGVVVGKVYCGESMFAEASDASKVGFAWLVDTLVKGGCVMIDCQTPTDHLARFGAAPMPRDAFLSTLEAVRDQSPCLPPD